MNPSTNYGHQHPSCTVALLRGLQPLLKTSSPGGEPPGSCRKNLVNQQIKVTWISPANLASIKNQCGCTSPDKKEVPTGDWAYWWTFSTWQPSTGRVGHCSTSTPQKLSLVGNKCRSNKWTVGEWRLNTPGCIIFQTISAKLLHWSRAKNTSPRFAMHSKQRPERYTQDPGGARHLGNRTWHQKTHYLQGSYLLKVAASSWDQVRPMAHQTIFQNILKAQSLPMSFVWLTMFIDFFLASPIKQCSKPGTSSLFFEGCPWSHEVEKVLLQW